MAALNIAMADADRTLVRDLMRNYMMDQGSSEGKVILALVDCGCGIFSSGPLLDNHNSCLSDYVSCLCRRSSLHQRQRMYLQGNH